MQHNRMWWKRLLEHHPEIVWDDDCKDYSDLPAPIMEEHRQLEHRQDTERAVEHTEKKQRERLQEADVRPS